MKISDQTVIDDGPEFLSKDALGSVEHSYVVTRDGREPETKVIFNDELALAHLLMNEAVFIGGSDGPLYVICNDVFAWGCADGEDLPLGKVEEVYKYWRQDPAWGTTIWCLIQRKELPQRPVANAIRTGGVWDLDKLTVEHGLRANHYDGLSHVMADYKREIYKAWCETTNKIVLPFDAGWWAGWKEFTTANPDWYSDAFKAEEKRRRDAWRAENGYTDG